MKTIVKPREESASRPSGTRRFMQPDGEIRIVPSLLAADFGALGDAVKLMESAGADWASVDVMDGHFVPNLSFGPDHIRALRLKTRMALDAHLMVDNPKWFAPMFVQAGAHLVIIHHEACPKPKALLKDIRAHNTAAGLALKPSTPASAALAHLDDLDLVLVMTVEPGFGGQSFLYNMLPKVRELRNAIDRSGKKIWLMVDGGVNMDTVSAAADAGANALVAGTSVFRAPDPVKAFRDIRKKAEDAFGNR